jgi:hypothetical protein
MFVHRNIAELVVYIDFNCLSVMQNELEAVYEQAISASA